MMSVPSRAWGIDPMLALNTALSGLAVLIVLSSAFRLVFTLKPVIK